MHSTSDLWCIQCYVNPKTLHAQNQNTLLVHLFVGRDEESVFLAWQKLSRGLEFITRKCNERLRMASFAAECPKDSSTHGAIDNNY